METDPGLFFPEVMIGSRDDQVFPLYGQEKDAGAIDAPLFPTNGIALLVNAIGGDANPGYGVLGTAGGSVSTTLSAGQSAGASTVAVASVSGVVANTTIIQIDVNNTMTPTTAECRLVTLITGSTLTLDAPLVYAHLSSAAVKSVVAPFTHEITELATLPSMTIEKNLGGSQSYQFAGSRVNKYTLKGQATDTEAAFTADLVSQSVAVLESPSAISFLDEEPFVFAEFNLEWDGGQLSQAGNFSIDLDNQLKTTYTFNGYHQAQFITPTALKVNGTFDTVFDALEGGEYAFFTQIQTGTEAALSFTLQHPAVGGGPPGYPAGYSVALNMPAVRLAKESIAPKLRDVLMENLSFEARRNLSASPSTTITATIINGVHTAIL